MGVTVLRDDRPVARKRHTCQGCMKPIEPGTRYVRQANVYDGTAYTWKAHVLCFEVEMDLRREYWMEDDDAIDPDELLAEIEARRTAANSRAATVAWATHLARTTGETT